MRILIEQNFGKQGIKAFIQEGKTTGTLPHEIPWKEAKVKDPKALLEFILEAISLD